MEGPGGNRKNNGFLPLGGGASTVHPANMPGAAGDRRMGSFPLGSTGEKINPPNDGKLRFTPGDVPNTSSGSPNSAVEPGRGDVPVNPFLPGGAAARSLPVSDMAPSAETRRPAPLQFCRRRPSPFASQTRNHNMQTAPPPTAPDPELLAALRP